MNVIRISAIGGLGNQLFIWNLAHLLESKYNCKIKIYFPKSRSNRKCEISKLKEFCNHRIEVTESNRLGYAFGVLNRIIRKFPKIGSLINNLFSVVQTNLPSETFYLTANPPRFVNGYFQSTKLVEENWNSYKDELILATKTIVEVANFRELTEISGKMIHIRRGDFVENKKSVGLLSIEYFSKQVKTGEKVTIFTDAVSSDPEIEKSFPSALIFDGDSLDTWTSFSLLSQARHLIISNSTFSWWAGMISITRGGIVVAPQPWTLTNVYGANHLHNTKFQYTDSIFEQDNSQNTYPWR